MKWLPDQQMPVEGYLYNRSHNRTSMLQVSVSKREGKIKENYPADYRQHGNIDKNVW